MTHQQFIMQIKSFFSLIKHTKNILDVDRRHLLHLFTFLLSLSSSQPVKLLAFTREAIKEFSHNFYFFSFLISSKKIFCVRQCSVERAINSYIHAIHFETVINYMKLCELRECFGWVVKVCVLNLSFCGLGMKIFY